MHPDFAAARRAMIESQLRPEGVTDLAVLTAMGRVPREDFLPEALRPLAYSDRPLDLGDGREMMPPAALGRLLTELQPRKGERALVIGTAPEYAAAVLAEIGLEVDTAAKPEVAPKGPYDLVLIDGAVPEVPTQIAGLLSPSGRLGGAIVDGGITRLATGRAAAGVVGLKSFADAEVPILPGYSKPPAFTF